MESEIRSIPKGKHATEHQTGGIDEISILDLAGLAADAQVPLPHSHLTVVETEVFAGAAPIAWTDLDLSAVVGTNPALVLLKFAETGDVGTINVAVRKNGDTDEFYSNVAQGVAFGIGGRNSIHHTVLLVVTDNAGIIEWDTLNGQTVTVDVMAFNV